MEALIASILGNRDIQINDPVTMILSEAEVRRAHSIKAAVESDPTLHSLSDFEYVQYALTHPLNDGGSTPLSKVLHCVAQMQAFREQYGIQETIEEAEECINDMTLLQPGLFLGLQYLPSTGNCISINDWAAFFPRKIQTREQYSQFLRGSYYRFQSMSPTFLAIREGMANLFECEGVSSENYDSAFHERLFAELYLSYPKRHKEVFFVNSPTIVNIAYGLWKRFMTTNMKQTFHLGFQVQGLEGYRIDGLFKTPTPEHGRRTMINKAKWLLTVRYGHQATYQLPDLANVNGHLREG